MSDDLIKRNDAPEQIFASKTDEGWRWPRASKFPEQGPYENIRYIRADRIEELECERYEAVNAAWRNGIAREKAQAKLAKAVETLRCLEIAATGAGVPHPQERKLLHEQIALTRTTLAELEGEK